MDEYRVYGPTKSDKKNTYKITANYIYLLKTKFDNKSLLSSNYELNKMEGFYPQLQKLDLFINVYEVQSGDFRKFREFEHHIFHLLQTKGNLTHINI